MLDLNDRLFAQLDRISNPELSGEALKDELARTSAVIGIGKAIVDNGNLVLRAAVAQDEKLRKGDRVIFLDGNKQNITAENLAKVSGSQLARLNQNHLLYSDAALSRTGVLMSKLLEAKAKAEKRKQ